MNRRTHLKMLGTIGLMSPIQQLVCSSNEVTNTGFNIHLFSKHLQWLDYKDMSEAAKQMGFDGLDLTVRRKGHVLPENVERDLPKAVAAMHKAGLQAEMMSTNITNIQDPTTEKILKTASQLGIKSYRMGWMKYKEDQPIAEQIESFKPQLKELEQMNEHYNIRGDYQNHAGTSVGSAVWDIWLMIKDLNPEWIGCQYDIRHAMVEGLNSWEVGLKLLQSHIRTLDLKDFIYIQKDNKWTVKNVPIGEGAVDFQKYFGLLKKLNITAPISIHAEYDLGGAEHGAKTLPTIPAEQVIATLKQDLTRLKGFIAQTK